MVCYCVGFKKIISKKAVCVRMVPQQRLNLLKTRPIFNMVYQVSALPVLIPVCVCAFVHAQSEIPCTNGNAALPCLQYSSTFLNNYSKSPWRVLWAKACFQAGEWEGTLAGRGFFKDFFFLFKGRHRKKHAAPEGNTLCFTVACVDGNQMVSWDTRSDNWGAKHMVNS